MPFFMGGFLGSRSSLVVLVAPTSPKEPRGGHPELLRQECEEFDRQFQMVVPKEIS
jgi:hypothetical protein